MATWHQQKAGLVGLYTPSPKAWTVVINPPNECAGRIEFSTKRKAIRYVNHAKRNGYARSTTLIPPTRYKPRNV